MLYIELYVRHRVIERLSFVSVLKAIPSENHKDHFVKSVEKFIRSGYPGKNLLFNMPHYTLIIDCISFLQLSIQSGFWAAQNLQF